ncbi:MAG: Omp28-related outer membrane protein [Chlorobi bacterium]|nr:Omp28-related outer membrane protein [Chlorobiota bacterium]
MVLIVHYGCESNDEATNSVYIPQPVNKKVLVEFFTNAGCNPCIAAHHYLDQLSANIGTTINDTSVIIISYHTKYPYIFDSLYRANILHNQGRSDYYGINFTPQGRLDGNINMGQFSSANWGAFINAEFNTTAYLSITLSNNFNLNTDSGTVIAEIELLNVLPASDNVVHIIISENEVSYVTSPNGITKPNDVMRFMVTGKDGEPINIGQNETVTKNYGLAQNWNADKCYITVFVQSSSTKQVFGVERIKIN